MFQKFKVMMENNTLLALYVCGRHDTLFLFVQGNEFSIASEEIDQVFLSIITNSVVFSCLLDCSAHLSIRMGATLSIFISRLLNSFSFSVKTANRPTLSL